MLRPAFANSPAIAEPGQLPRCTASCDVLIVWRTTTSFLSNMITSSFLSTFAPPANTPPLAALPKPDQDARLTV
jgi:hypothetical protein